MLGRTHALSGAVLALAAVPAAPLVGVDVSNPMTVAAIAIAGAGAGMLPDADHGSASIAWALPPFTRWLCRGIGAISGGHRNGTHSVVGLAGFVGFALLVQHAGGLLEVAGVQPGRAQLAGSIIMGVWLGFLFAIATTALRLKPVGNKVLWTLLCLSGGAGVAYAGIAWPFDTGAVVWAVGIGVVAHVAGDMLTKEGCPLLWPWRNGGKWRMTLLPRAFTFTTDTWPERLIVGPLLAVAFAALIFVQLPADVTGPLRHLLSGSGDLLNLMRESVGR